MRYKIQLETFEAGWKETVLDTDDLLGVITGALSSYTVVLDARDPLSSKVTISRIGDGE